MIALTVAASAAQPAHATRMARATGDVLTKPYFVFSCHHAFDVLDGAGRQAAVYAQEDGAERCHDAFCSPWYVLPLISARFSPDDKFSRNRIVIKKRFGLLPTQQSPLRN